MEEKSKESVYVETPSTASKLEVQVENGQVSNGTDEVFVDPVTERSYRKQQRAPPIHGWDM